MKYPFTLTLPPEVNTGVIRGEYALTGDGSVEVKVTDPDHGAFIVVASRAIAVMTPEESEELLNAAARWLEREYPYQPPAPPPKATPVETPKPEPEGQLKLL